MTAGPVPIPTPDTLPYWEAAARNELHLPHCDDCDRFFFYPRSSCPYCGHTAISWHRVSGEATIASFVINYRPLPAFESNDPQVIALVELKEGPRMLSNIVGVDPDPEKIVLGARVSVDFVDRGDWKLPVFVYEKEQAA
jgi:uncharacterized OB-fold protein